MYRANLTARVEEAAGNESVVSRSVLYSPYSAYIGINLGDKEFETDTDLRFPVVVLDENGNALDARKLEYKIYRNSWSYWYEYEDSYKQSANRELVASGDLSSENGRAEVKLVDIASCYAKMALCYQDSTKCADFPLRNQIALYPSSNASVIRLPEHLDGSAGFFISKLSHNNPDIEVFWHLDDKYLGSTKDVHQFSISPSLGFHTITVVDALGAEKKVEIIVKD